jgi:CRISPR system Cascade subunit CasD
MQSWGTDSRFVVRGTNLEPSKSGVVGLLCSALGRSRDENMSDLSRLKMGVRVDFPGMVKKEYQTAIGERGLIRLASGGKRETAVISDRYYLNEADFLVGLKGTESLLEELDKALRNPKWHLFLGRKSFVPSVPVWIPDGLKEGSLESVLKNYPWPGVHRDVPRTLPKSLKTVIETKDGKEIRTDQPLSFDDRRFGSRYVVTAVLGLNDVPMNDVPILDGGE